MNFQQLVAINKEFYDFIGSLKFLTKRCVLLNEDRAFCAKSPGPLSREGWGLGTRLPCTDWYTHGLDAHVAHQLTDYNHMTLPHYKLPKSKPINKEGKWTLKLIDCFYTGLGKEVKNLESPGIEPGSLA